MKFKPKASRTNTHVAQCRINIDDWEEIERIAKEMETQTSDIIRQCVHFALENMDK